MSESNASDDTGKGSILHMRQMVCALAVMGAIDAFVLGWAVWLGWRRGP